MSTVVIVGASVGGIKSAQALRLEGYTGRIVLIDSEPGAAYDKPPLSKSYLQPDAPVEEIALLSSEETIGLDAEFLMGSAATSLDTRARTVTLESGQVVEYDTLIIATGSRARRSPWGEGPGMHVLRTSADAERRRDELKPGRSLLIVGAGFIGAEVAATAVKHGVTVTMIDPLPAPMSRVLNEVVGTIFATKHRDEGVTAIFGQTVSSVVREDDGFHVELSDGSSIRADGVLVGIGAIVNTEWLDGSGLVLDNGVVCGPGLHALGADDIFAVGDVARWNSTARNEALRLEHWTNAVDQAKAVAHNIMHPDDVVDYETVEYVWSDQYDWKIQVVGRTGSTDFHLLGDPADDKFAALYAADDGALVGAVVVNWPRALVASRRAVAVGRPASELAHELEGSPGRPAVATTNAASG